MFSSIIPILIASFCATPYADDFSFFAGVHKTIVAGDGFFDVISSAIQQVIFVYKAWQGTYSAVFLFALQPAAFSEKLYFVTTFILLGFLIGSTFFFIDSLFKVAKLNRWYGLVISSTLLFISIQFVVNKAEAFYWWNGAIYYTFVYSLMLILLSCLIKMHQSSKLVIKIVLCVVASLLVAIIGGGNYTTVLLSLII